ncbi:odorant receptor 13a-like [Aphidius gifuensis]|uniref:odorant receptor 13a-like n=1 Tax=Aphidius gifuensis TaxID=684658 RepID=UPI001CDD4292|nr:odorant receptor 13a-like [Aphidius gifuensis]XP_044013388.1 odorant receptor 13a-like [Aphidius gifuensis]XP_044013389.1 odorant receptor 13a-like [Aphidius gifuensis]
MKKLFIIMQKNWNDIKSKEDKKLLVEFAERGKLSMRIYAAAIFGVVGVYFLSAVVPKFLDIVKPLNESRNHVFLYETEYFVDQDKYYYQILLHGYLTVPISVGVIIFFDNMLACYVSHICGCLAVVSANLKRLHIDTEPYTEKNNFEKNQRLHKRIIYCAKIHNNTLEFVKLVESSVSTALIFVIGFSTVIITVTGIVSVMKLNDPNEAARFMAFAFGGISHLYYISSQGNLLIQESEAVHKASYFCEWYTLPPTYRKLIIIIMMRSKKPAKITAGKFYTLCNESFGDGLKKAMSLFTLLKSSL